MKTVVYGIAVTLVILVSVGALLVVPDTFFNPRRYADALPQGMSHKDVLDQMPKRFVLEEIHPLSTSKYTVAQAGAQQMGITPAYVMVLHDTLWPLTQATVCFLYFDERNNLIDVYCSSS
jgi:hypothetical protein